MSHQDVDSYGSEDENGGFALGTIFTVSRESLPSVLRYHQHSRADPFVIAILSTTLFRLTICTPAPAPVSA